MSAAVSVLEPSILSDPSASLGGGTTSLSADIWQLYRSHADTHDEPHSFDHSGEGPRPSAAASTSEQDLPPSRSDTREKRLPNVADWKGTLDLVTGMAGVADGQQKDLNEQTEAQHRALEDLRSELTVARQRLHVSEQRAQELRVQGDSRLQRIQADLDAQVQEAHSETEARVRVIRARNDGLIRATEERVRAAELRSQTAEQWLQRIDTATKNLLLNGSMNRNDRSCRETVTLQHRLARA